MTSRLKWVKTLLRELISQGGRNYYSCSNSTDLKGFSQVVRSSKDNHGKGGIRCHSIREMGRAAPVSGVQKHLLHGDALRELVASLINRVYQGTAVDSKDYVDVLRGCSRQKDLDLVEQVHDCIKKCGLEQNRYVANSLLRCYIGCGRLQLAQDLFTNLLHKDYVSWTIMIGGYAEHGRAEDAIEVYKKMRNEGVRPNAITYLSVLKACDGPVSLIWGKAIHAHILHDGFQADVRVGTALIHMYAKCGSVDDARVVFDRMVERDVICWNALIGGLAQHGHGQEAFSLFHLMQKEGIVPDAATYLSILNPNTCEGALAWVKEVHSHAARSGLNADLRVGNALIHMYAKSGSMDNAREVFDRMVKRDVISWNAIIGGLAQHGNVQGAFSLFQQMQREGFTPDLVTYLNILSASAQPRDLAWAQEVHRHAKNAGLGQNLRVNTAIIQMYAKCGCIDDAKLVFDTMTNHDVTSWTAMIGALAQDGRGHEAFAFFQHMQNEGVVPNVATYISILNSNACQGALGWVKEVHSHATRSGLMADLRVGSALVHMYAKCGSIEGGRAVFDGMEDRNVICWTAMIGGLALHGLGHEAFSLFLEMQREGFVPDSATYVSILNPCSSAGALEWVKEVHSHATKVGLDVDSRVGNALVHMYAKIGTIADARQVFDSLLDRDVVSWTVMIGGLAQHGHGREALKLFKELKVNDVRPSGPLFVTVLSACSHSGLVDEGRHELVSMKHDYGIEPALEHYNCMVDTLGRAGHLEEAKLFILNLPIEPNKITWMGLLGACRLHNNIKLAELAAKECLKLEPMDPSPYVILSNMYAAVGDWNRRFHIRRTMEERGLRKDAGRTWIAVDNKIHHFIAGDTSHPEAREIYAMLESLSRKSKAEGYSPDTRLVLRNLDEEYRESAVCSHSERLALAYGFIHMTGEEPIRIYKNLRMCTDCHAATKCISKVTGRQIVARDANRFHHFEDGVCSCGDYW